MSLYMNYMIDQMERNTTFRLTEYAGDHNGYNPNLLHPHNHFLHIQSTDGTSHKISVGALETILKLMSYYSSPGKFIDEIYLATSTKFPDVKL